MKIGLLSGFTSLHTPDVVAEVGRMAEERGFASFWVPEHVVFFPDYASRYPYAADGKLPGNPDGVLEPWTALTWLAAHTSTIRLGTGICLVPQRNPVYTAKQVADVDFLSRGRVDFGIGIGWLREEFDALGVPWERRGERTRECIGVMKTLWCDEVSHFEGEFFSIERCLLNPKPVQKPHPPLYFGGESDAALRRVAELGQGWFGFDLTPDALAERLERLDALLVENGRSLGEIQIFASPKGQRLDTDTFGRFADLGVDQVIVPLTSRDAEGYAHRADGLLKITGSA